MLTIQPDGTEIYTPFADYEEEYLPTSNRQPISIERAARAATAVPAATDANGRSPNNNKRTQATTANILSNGDFESGSTIWWSNGSWSAVAPGYNGSYAGQFVASDYSNQFMQTGLTLEANTALSAYFRRQG